MTARRTSYAIAVAVGVLLGGLVVAGEVRAEPAGCGWTTAGSGGPTGPLVATVSPDADETHLNVLFGELDAHYWNSFERIPRGGYIEYSGEFPHARFMSFTNYGGGIRSVDSVYDAQIIPDDGSRNPFLPQADRNVEPRNFTVRFVDGQAPPMAQRPPNTFYRVNEDGSNSSNALAPTVTLRVYTPDNGYGPQGGVALPEITIVDAEGRRTPLGSCPSGGLPDLGHDEVLMHAGLGVPLPSAVADLVDTDPFEFRKFTGYLSSATGEDGGATGPGGFGDNHEQAYMHDAFRKTAGEVLVIRGKAPTFVDTWDGAPVMGAGQLRFWTMCTYAMTTNGYDCMRDDQTPVDRDGFFTYVISTTASRPRNATTQCGVAWLPAGPTTEATVIYRHLLPASDFAHSIQASTFGDEAASMGDYYPTGTYMSASDFERLGCSHDSDENADRRSPPATLAR